MNNAKTYQLIKTEDSKVLGKGISMGQPYGPLMTLQEARKACESSPVVKGQSVALFNTASL